MSDTSIAATKKKVITRIVTVILALIAINIIAYKWFAQVDLTKDKRYTITETTKSMLKNMKGTVEVTIFLEGDYLPSPFKNLRSSTEELLRNFQNQSNQHLTYKFVDPIGKDNEATLEIMKKYRMTGIPVTIAGKSGSEQRMVFPWALVKYNPGSGQPVREIPVFLQESNSMVLSRSILNKSEILLEYNLANAINTLQKDQRDAIAYLMGNGEPFGDQIASAIMSLGKYYSIDTINLQNETVISPSKYKAIFINQPKSAFSDVDKFKIDQFIMNGGNVLMSLDNATGSIDSFYYNEHFTALAVEHNLGDLLFQYGIRINNNLVLDGVENTGIPVATDGATQQKMFSWPYHPIVKPYESQHPITKNLEGVLTKFVSGMEILKGNPNFEKTVLLSSSAYSKTQGTPAAIIYKTILDEPDMSTFRQKNIPVAVLLEGNGVSAYAANKPESVHNFIQQNNIKPATQAKKGKIIIVSDGDMFLNEVSEQSGPREMGMYMFIPNYQFDNRTFLLNSMEYLTNENHLLEARSKTIDNRSLDPKRVEAERSKWQLITIALPIAIFSLLGFGFAYYRKKKYSK